MNRKPTTAAERPGRLTLARETLRQLTSDEIRLVVGGAASSPSNSEGISCYRAGAC